MEEWIVQSVFCVLILWPCLLERFYYFVRDSHAAVRTMLFPDDDDEDEDKDEDEDDEGTAGNDDVCNCRGENDGGEKDSSENALPLRRRRPRWPASARRRRNRREFQSEK